MKFDWSKIDGADASQQLAWLRAWGEQLQRHVEHERSLLDIDACVTGELLLMQRERLLHELQTVIKAAECGVSDFHLRLSSLHIAMGCQQLLQTNNGYRVTSKGGVQ